MYTHTWTATDVDYDNKDGRVTHVHYLLESSDKKNTQRSYGTVRLVGDISIPILNVTKELACSWAKRTLGRDGVLLKQEANESILRAENEVGKTPWK